jgi:23S rRNA (uracil1939-C5)-methyltransferase
MVILVADGKIKNTNTILNKLLDLKLVSLYENINKNKKFRFGKKFNKIYGQDRLDEKINDIDFKISPSAFFQVNRKQTKKLYQLASDYLDPRKDEKVLDLYCGVGSISLTIADKVKEVIGVEILEEAVINARENAKINGIENARFIADKSENIIDKISESYQGINKIILDPPRSGLHKNLVEQLLNSNNIEKIVYISCNPSTQARDLKLLKEKYKLEKISMVDMFANSVHVESICTLIREN